MCENLIKIFNKEIASMLMEGGFSYVEEKINDNQHVYVFDYSDELINVINSVVTINNFQEEIIYVVDDKLRF